MLESLFNKFAGLQADNFITKGLQHSCFSVNIAKFLKTSILKDICEWFWTLLIQSGRDVFREKSKEVKNTEKTETCSETVIGDVFRTQWNI